jgi:hypothetical protein
VLDEFDLVRGAPERAQNPVDPVFGLAVASPDAPFVQALDQQLIRGRMRAPLQRD